MNEQKLEEIARSLLKEIGEDIERPGIKDTPSRMARMWKEIYKGYDSNNFPFVRFFPNNCDGVCYNQIVIDTGKFHSFCEHHNAIFLGRYYFGYIPNELIVGLSKIARIIDYYSSKLQVQERIGEEVCHYLEQTLNPKGMILVMKASHTCKSIRGVKKEGEMTTSIVRGIFKEDAAAKNEFFSLINLK